MATTHLAKARYENINDEFYTRYEDVEAELKHYRLVGRTVLCPCDTEQSAFVQYFKKNFAKLKIKELWYTYLGADVVYIYDGHTTNTWQCPYIDCTNGNLLNSCNIVITNPPFSLYKQMFEAIRVSFILVTSLHKLTIKSVAKRVLAGKCRLGYNAISQFILPDGTLQKFGNTYWLTTSPVKYVKPHDYADKLTMQKYYNLDCIFVSRVSAIVFDYYDPMAVPLTFLYGFPYEDFEILGLTVGSSWNDINKIKTTPIKSVKVYETDELINKLADKAMLPNESGKYLLNDSVRADNPFIRLVIRRKR